MERLGAIASLGARAAAALVWPPFGWARHLPGALTDALRIGALPALVVVGAGAASTLGVQLGDFLAVNGQVERVGGFLTVTSLRWLGPALGVVALAVAAGGPLAARLAASDEPRASPRGERSRGAFVAAQVIAFALAGVVIAALGVPVAVASGVAVAVATLDAPAGPVLANVFANATSVDVVSSVARAGVSGALVGLVCCHSGLASAARAEDGSSADTASTRAGRARAVRDALVGSLLAVLFVNVVLGMYSFAAFPDIRFSR